MRRVVLSSYLGSVIEFYDFLLYGLAASLVFGHVFFSNLSPAVGLVASFGTLAAGYIARPLGGVVFGHFGDKLGRKSMLVMTMTIMGVASTLIGLLPTYDQIGELAPILLILLRVIQGIAVGGEWGGAALMSLEHSPAKSRGMMASFTNAGGPSGALLGTLVMTAFATLPQEQFLSWGWRVPFLLSSVLVVVGLVVRLKVAESPVFQEVKHDKAEKKPIIEVLTNHHKEVLLAVSSCSGAFLIQGLLATFAISLAVTSGASRPAVLLAHGTASFLHIFTIPAFAALSDRVGRRPVMIAGAIAGAVMAVPIFELLRSGSTALVLLAFIIGNPLIQACMYGPMAAFVTEMFGAKMRYTGASLGYQLSTTLGAGVGPLVASSLLVFGGGNPIYVAALVVAVCLVSAASIYRTRESYRASISEQPLASVVAKAA
jgi:metabolite-proton symporter